MGSPSPVHSRDAGTGSKHDTGQPPHGYRVPRQRHKATTRAPRGRDVPPDLPAIARQAVEAYLHDAAERPAGAGTTGTDALGRVDTGAEATGADAAGAETTGADAAGAETTGADGAGSEAAARRGVLELAPRTGLAAASPETAQEMAVRAAQVSLATLDRIEAAAAELEADIAAARTEQARLQAGAGTAAADAIKAAEAAWTAAGSAAESSRRAKLSLRMITSWVIIAAILVVIQLVIVLVFAVSVH